MHAKAQAAVDASVPVARRPVAALYDQHPRAIAVLMGWFFLRHLNNIYRRFEGDLLIAIILGEIAHHNICHYFSAGRVRVEKSPDDLSAPSIRLEPCNAFSLSVATGIPRETCRRKIRTLLRDGLIQRHAKGGYIVAPDVGSHFRETNLKTLGDLQELIRELERIAATDPEAPPRRKPRSLAVRNSR